MRAIERVRRLLLPMMLVFVLAVPVRAACDHDYVPMRQDPGCETPGFVWLTCRLCGHTTCYDTLPPLGHAFSDWEVLTEPTCSQDGVQVRSCGACGLQETAVLACLGHEYVAEVIPPTCTARGYTRYYCHRCGKLQNTADYTEPLGHRYDDGVILNEPTDTAMGRILYTCIGCGITYQKLFPKPDKAFEDVEKNTYYYIPVLWALTEGITDGLDETHFGPAAVCNRAQVVTFLWRAAGKPEPETAENPFRDVPAGSFYEQAVLWAYESGITTGTDTSHFSPDAPCNRAQVVTFLHRFRGCPEPTAATAFPDVPQGTFYHKAVLWAAQCRITMGMDGGFFCPGSSCSRAQIVTFLYRDAKNS